MPSSRDLVRRGQEWSPPRADLQNSWTETASAFRFATRDLKGKKTETPLRNVEIFIEASSSVSIGSVVGFGQPLNLVTDRSDSRFEPVFAQSTPSEGRFAVAKHGVENGAVAACVLIGVAWTQVDVQATTDTHADWISGSLKSARNGYAKILYKPGGTGVNWCCLQLGETATAEARWILGVADVDINPGETQSVTRTAGYDPGAATIQATLSWFHGGEKVSSGKQVGVRWFPDLSQWIIMHAECED